MSITHEICQSFDDGLEVKRVFYDIFKAFDKVWHEALIYELKQNGIKGNLLDTLSNFLNDRNQRVILNGQHSKWANIGAGVPQGSILVHYFFDINDLPDNLISNPELFSGDASLFSVIEDKHSSINKLNQDLNRRNNWALQWKMSFNLTLVSKLRKLSFLANFKSRLIPHYKL